MRKKYIIELEENEHLYKTEMVLGEPVLCGVLAEPYTVPDLEKILEQAKADAYQEGLKDGQAVTLANEQNNAFNNGYKKCLEDMEQVRKEERDRGYEDGYECGLDDAWKAARTIIEMDWEDKNKIFGKDVFLLSNIFSDNTAAEAIEKLKQYEKEQEGFHVGDEFENETGKKFVVLKTNGSEIDRYIDADGQTYHMNVKYKVMRKTGRHFPEITTFFEKMRKGQE